MALETIKDLHGVGDALIVHLHGNEPLTELREREFIIINHEENSITFNIQKGPIKEVGLNGCQVSDLIAVAQNIITGLNQNFPCEENEHVIKNLETALTWSDKRTKNRESRGVEGYNKA